MQSPLWIGKQGEKEVEKSLAWSSSSYPPQTRTDNCSSHSEFHLELKWRVKWKWEERWKKWNWESNPFHLPSLIKAILRLAGPPSSLNNKMLAQVVLGTWSQLCLVGTELVKTGWDRWPSNWACVDASSVTFWTRLGTPEQNQGYRTFFQSPFPMLPTPQTTLLLYWSSHKYPEPSAFIEGALRLVLPSLHLAALGKNPLSVLACCAWGKTNLVQ